MKIELLEMYGVFDASDPIEIEKICKKIENIDNDVILDLSRCILDYPISSTLSDDILFKLEAKVGQKTLVIKVSQNINELLLLHWLFIGSKFFNIGNDAKNQSIESLKSVVRSKLQTTEILLTLQVSNKNKELIATYQYE